MGYLETRELSFYSHLRMAERICMSVEYGDTLEEALDAVRNFRIPSTMMAIDTLIEYGWERAINVAINNDYKAEDILLPEDLAEAVGGVIAKEFVDSVKHVQEYYKVDDEELINFLKTLYQSEEIADIYGDAFGYWDLHNLYEDYKKSKDEIKMSENKLVKKVEYTGKFKAGDRVRVIAATEKTELESVGKTGILLATFSRFKDAPYVMKYDDGGAYHYNEANLELVSRVTHEDFSKEYTAVAYLLRHKGNELRKYLLDKTNNLARVYLEKQDYDNAREAMDIAEELKEKTK